MGRALLLSTAGLLVFITALVRSLPEIKAFLSRTKSRLIANYVNKAVQKMFLEKGGRMELGKYIRPSDGAEVDFFKNAPRTLPEWYALGLQFGNDDHIVHYVDKLSPPVRLSFKQVASKADSLAFALKTEFSVQAGDRVSILMSNIPEFAFSFMAVTSLQAIAVTLNAFWSGEEIEFGLEDSQTSVLIVDRKRLERMGRDRVVKLMKQQDKFKVICVGPVPFECDDSIREFNTILNENQGRVISPPLVVDPNADAYIMYTSGTTSPRPKGVVQTHISTVNTIMCFQFFAELIKRLRPAAAKAKRRVDLVTGPLFHTAALNPVFLLSFHDGHKLVMIPKWETDYALDICLKEDVTFFGAMPTLLQDILASPFFHQNIDKFKFTNIGTGGASTPGVLIQKVSQAMPHVTQGSGWGMTETNAVGTIIGGPDYLAFPDSCGKAHPIVKLRFVDPDTMEERQNEGELLVHSITNMRGYWNNEEETKKVLLPGNWIRTGDYGRIDEDGFVRIVDRVKEIVIRGGENISCTEIESCMYAYDSSKIAEVVAFGLPHERLGEQLCAVVVPRAGCTLDLDEMKVYLGTKLAPFKVPSLILLRESALPRGGTGKILKRLLKEEYKNYAL